MVCQYRIYTIRSGSDGNVTLNVSMDPLVAYPVGSIYMSVNSTNPSQLFGGTWVALNEGRVLIGAGTSYPAGSTGGEATHTLTVNEMPSHSHSGSTGSTGDHSHTRGSMNITSSSTAATQIGHWSEKTDTFTVGAIQSITLGNYGPRAQSSYRTGYYKVLNFDASRNWSGSTSSTGSHSHSMSLDNTGGGSAHNNMQPYLSVYMWKRTA